MSSLEPMIVRFLDARRESLMQLLLAVTREAEHAMLALKSTYNSLVDMMQEVDRTASQWVETNFEDAPAVLMVSVAIFMVVTVMAVTWGKETTEHNTEEDLKIVEEEKAMDDDMLELNNSKLTLTKQVTWDKETTEQNTEEDLKIVEEEKTMDDDMLELINSKLTLTKQLDDIAVIQDEARKEIIKDALALAILGDRLTVINSLKKDVGFEENKPQTATEGTEIHVQSTDENNVDSL